MKHLRTLRTSKRLGQAAAFGALAWAMPATAAVWTSAVSGDWGDSSKWTPTGVPGASDNATIAASGSAFTLTVASPTVVNQVLLNSPDATLQVVGGLTVSSFTYLAGNVTGTVTFNNSASLNIGANATGGGSFLMLAGGIVGGGGITGVTIQSGMTVTSRGTAAFPNPFLSLNGPQSTNLGTLTIETAAGVNSSGSTLNLNGMYTNAGTFNLNGGGTAQDLRSINGSGALTNTGTMNVNTDTTFNSSVGLNNAGTINVAAGKTLNVGNVTQSAGTLNVAGTFLGGSTFNYLGGAINGTVTFDNSTTLNLGTGPVTGGTFLLRGGGFVAGGGVTGVTIQSGVTVISRGTASFPNPLLTLNGPQSANLGTLTIETAAGVNSSGSTVNVSGTYTNAGTFNLNGGGTAQDLRSINGSGGLVNTGTMNVNTDTTFNSSVGLANSGTINIALGKTLTAGNVTQSAGTLNIDGTFLGGSTFNYMGGTIDGNVTFDNSTTLNLGTGPLGGGIFRLLGGGFIAGGGGTGVTIQSGMVIMSRGTAAFPNPLLTLNGPQSANFGTIVLQTAPGVNSSGSTLNLSGTYTNAGVMTFNGGGTAQDLRTINGSGALVNTGTMNVNTDTTFNSSVGLANTGTVTVAAGKTLTVGTVTQSAGTLNIGGTFKGGSTFNYTGGEINGTVTFDNSTTLNLGTGLVSGGTFLLQGGGFIAGGGVTGVTIQSGLNLISRGTASFPNPLLTLNGPQSANFGVLTLETTAGVNSSGSTLNLSGTYTNAGTFNLNGGGTAQDLRSINGSGALVNTGTMNVNTDTTFNSSVGLANSGTVNVAAGKTLNVGTVTQSAGALNVAGTFLGGSTFNYMGGTVNGTVTFDNSTTLNLGTGPVAGGTFLLRGGGFIAGGGVTGVTVQSSLTILSRGTASFPNPLLTLNGPQSTNLGTITLETAAGVNSSGSTLNLSGTYTNAGTLNLNGGGTAQDLRSINGSGALVNTGTMNVNTDTTFNSSVGLSNTGTLNVAAGKTLTLSSVTQSAGSLNIAGSVVGGSTFNYMGGAINGTVTFNNSTSLNLGTGSVGGGTFLLQGGGFVAGGGVTGVTIQSGVNVTSRGTASFPSPLLSLNGPTSANFGTITLESAAGVSGGSTLSLNGTYTNAGTINFNAGGVGTPTRTVSGSGAVLSNAATGVINFNTPVAFGGGASLSNAGTVNYNTTMTLPTPGLLSNGGTVNIASGATVTSTIVSIGGGQLNVSGTLNPSQFSYGGGAVNGTVNFLGGPPKSLRFGQQSTASGTFIFSGNGTVTGIPPGQGIIGQGATIISRGSTTLTTLTLTTGVQNRGTITLEAVAGAPANHVVAINVVPAGFTNNGVINFNAGATAGPNARTIGGGTLTNSAGATFNFNGGSTTTFYNSVVNNGTFKNTDSTVNFVGTFTNNGAYLSDPAVNNFEHLEVGTNGYLKGGAGDVFVVSGNFTNASIMKTEWDTKDAQITFTAGNSHTVTVVDDGEFAFGTIKVESGASLVLTDGDGQTGGGIFANTIELPIVNGAPDVSVLQVAPGAPIALVLNPDVPQNAAIVEAINESGNTGVTAELGYAPEPGVTGVIGLTAGLLLRRRRRAMISRP